MGLRDEKVPTSQMYGQQGSGETAAQAPRRDHQPYAENCYVKAINRGQRTFTLVEQDITAPRLICEWIKENIETAPSGKLHDALAHAINMRDFKYRKVAD